MFGFGKKKDEFEKDEFEKDEFDSLLFFGVVNRKGKNYIRLQLKNKYERTENRYLSLDLVKGYINVIAQPKVVEKVKTQASIWHVLAIMPTTDESKVVTAYKKMALVYHPDHGGSNEAFQALIAARDKALQKCK
jgi:hypothetical protein